MTAVGIVVLAPLLGGPHSRSRRSILLASIMAVETVAVAWLLMEYAIQASATQQALHMAGRYRLVKSTPTNFVQAWVLNLLEMS